MGEHLERRMEGIPVDPDVKAWFWRQAVSGLPDELTDEQLEAWVELASLASDDSFVEKIREQTRPFWEAAGGRFDRAGWDEATGEAVRDAVAAVREGRPPSGERERRVVEGWLEA